MTSVGVKGLPITHEMVGAVRWEVDCLPTAPPPTNQCCWAGSVRRGGIDQLCRKVKKEQSSGSDWTPTRYGVPQTECGEVLTPLLLLAGLLLLLLLLPPVHTGTDSSCPDAGLDGASSARGLFFFRAAGKKIVHRDHTAWRLCDSLT